MEYINTPLSNIDIQEAVKQFEHKGANIISDKIIEPDTDIEEIFKNRGHCIVYHAWDNQDIGHWYGIFRDPYGLIFFADSFGENPDHYNKNIIPCLKNNGIKEIIINKEKWQNNNSSICGRYGILISVLRKNGLNIDDIYNFMEKGKKLYKSYDKFVLEMTT